MTEEEKLVRRKKRKEYTKEWKKKNIERVRSYRCPDSARRASQKYNSNYPQRRLLHSAKQNSKDKECEFNISEEDIVIPTYCPYLGIELTNIQGSGRVESNISIDRIDNTKGYIKGNIQIISLLANIMKHNSTEEQLIAFAKGVLRVHDRTSDNSISP